MLQTLFFVPHEIAGLPVFGWGWLLVAWLIAGLGWSGWTAWRAGSLAPVWGFAPFLLVVGIAIVFVFPLLEAKDARGVVIGLPIRGYGTFVLAGFVLGMGWATYRAQRRGIEPEAISSLALWLFVAGFAGARLFFVVEYWDDFRRPTWPATLAEVVKFTEGGLVVYGALIAALPTLAVFSRRHAISPLALGDIVAPTLVLGLAFGRIGCLMNGCCYGGVCQDQRFCIRFPRYNSVAQQSVSPPYQHQLATGQLHGFLLGAGEPDGRPIVRSVTPLSPAAAAGLKAGMAIRAINGHATPEEEEARRVLASLGPRIAVLTEGGELVPWQIGELPARSLPVHPAQLYSAISALVIALVMVASEPYLARTGSVLALLLTLYPPLRIIEEMIRVDEPGQFGTMLTISQWISLGMMVVAGGLWAFLYGRAQPGGRDAWPEGQGLTAA